MICGLAAGLQQAMRLRMRERELSAFSGALAALKSAAAYTAGDLSALLSLCRDDPFLGRIHPEGDIQEAWRKAAKGFFSYSADCETADAFIAGYGQTDLAGLLSYITLFESRTKIQLQEAQQNAASKCKLYTVLGLFTGTVTALLLI